MKATAAMPAADFDELLVSLFVFAEQGKPRWRRFLTPDSWRQLCTCLLLGVTEVV